MRSKYSMLLIVLFLFMSKMVFCQHWIINDVTKYFTYKVVYGFAFTDSITWVCSDVIVKTNGKDFVKYNFDTNSSGKLKEFECENCDNQNIFKKIVFKDNVIYLYNDKRSFLKIVNDSVYNYRFNYEEKKLLFFSEFSIDSNNNLWFITENLVFYEGFEHKFKSNIYCLNSKEFLKYDLPFSIDTLTLNSFFIFNNHKYIVVSSFSEDLNLYYPKLLIIDQDNSYQEYCLREYRGPMDYKFDSNFDKVYLTGGSGDFFIIKNNTEFETIPTSLNSFGYCYSFKVIDEYIYFIYMDGIIKYNYLDMTKITITPSYSIDTEIMDNIEFRKNELWGVLRSCGSYLYLMRGMRILNLE